MTWFEKGQPTPFDEAPIHGLFFLDGDALAHKLHQHWTEGQMAPMIAFPSGLECALWKTGTPEVVGIVHIFGEMDLPLRCDRDTAFASADSIAAQCGYVARKVGEDRIEVWGHDEFEHVMITFDNAARWMVDVAVIVERRPEPRFALGRVVATPGVIQALVEANQDPTVLLARHVAGDWGDLCEEDRQENEVSVENGWRVFSAYTLTTGVKVWIITEADRSATTILLPLEY